MLSRISLVKFLLYVSFIYICLLTYFILISKTKFCINIHEKILVVLFSCDRSYILNKTFASFYKHMHYYEPNIKFNFYFVDSGTEDRLIYIKQYNINNVFYMNPNSYEYSYGMFWTFIHGNFILFLEDDRPFIKYIEKTLIYPNFIEESILVLKNTNEVKGIILKSTTNGLVNKKVIYTKLGKHILCIIISPGLGYYYCNGPAIYEVGSLLKTGYYNSEHYMAKIFKKKKWYTGFTYKGKKCRINNTFTSLCQTVSYHNGKNSTQNAIRRICKTSLY